MPDNVRSARATFVHGGDGGMLRADHARAPFEHAADCAKDVEIAALKRDLQTAWLQIVGLQNALELERDRPARFDPLSETEALRTLALARAAMNSGLLDTYAR